MMNQSKKRDLDDVPGWLTPVDKAVIEWILTHQSASALEGDLLELGVYQGKSAIHIGHYVSDNERLIVCDLFDDAGSEESIRADVRHFYRSLSQTAFESNYLDFHSDLPLVIRGLSSTIEQYVEPSSCRFVHIDASHMYEHVSVDSAAAKRLLKGQGVVAFDDYRTEHTPGTAAAVWESVISYGLHPICLTSGKFYGTWGDPQPYRNMIYQRLANRSDMRADDHVVFGGLPLIRVLSAKPSAPVKPSPRPVQTEVPEVRDSTVRAQIRKKLLGSARRCKRRFLSFFRRN